MKKTLSVRQILLVCVTSVALLSIAVLQAKSENVNSKKSSDIIQTKEVTKLRKFPSEKERDLKLEKAIIRQKGDNIFGIYEYSRIDLDNDKKPEVIAHMRGKGYCVSGGCTTLIFQQVGKDYKLVTDIGINYPPIIISDKKTNGWNDIIIAQFSEININNYNGYYVLKYNGKTYPKSPGDIKLPYNAKIIGKLLFNGNNAFELRM